MKKRTGWRAIIYDAPWAYFKKGQNGVIVSEDGKTCETIYDDKSSIVIVAEKNDEEYDRLNGHVLFKQKGSNLFDIVCLYQKASEKVYTLSVNNVQIDGCSDVTWTDFKSMLKPYWHDGTESSECTDFDIVSPTPQDVFSNIETAYTITITAKRSITSKNVYTAQSTCNISLETPVTSYTGTIFSIDCLKNIQPTKIGGNEVNCDIYPSNTESSYKGGKQTYNVNSVESNSVYMIDVSCAYATNNFKVTQCNDTINEFSEVGTLTWRVEYDSNVNVIQTSPTIKFSVKPGVRTITIIATETKYGVSSNPIIITLPTN